MLNRIGPDTPHLVGYANLVDLPGRRRQVVQPVVDTPTVLRGSLHLQLTELPQSFLQFPWV